MFRKVKNEKFSVNDHHQVICDVLDKVFAGELTRVIIKYCPALYKDRIGCKELYEEGAGP
jgi:hypothetical protein